jgi:hypothetical protein
LWCLERKPDKRPTADELLASELIPGVIELEQQYLDEALSVLTRPQVRLLMSASARPSLSSSFDSRLSAVRKLHAHCDLHVQSSQQSGARVYVRY